MRVVELFCGAGGMSRGLIDAGFEVVGAYDAWPVAVENYRRNIGDHVRQADLKDILAIVPEIAQLSPDMIAGGPPCQDYSLAGKREEGENANMTIAFAIIVAATRPEWFLMENVIRASTSEAWRQARAILKRAGYGISTSKVTASFYGVPQCRRRLVICGRLGERDGFLESDVAAAASPRAMTMRDLFGGDLTATSHNLAVKSGKKTVLQDQQDPTAAWANPERKAGSAYLDQVADIALLENGYVYSRPVRGGRGVRSIDEPLATITRTSWERPTPRYLGAPHPADPVIASETVVLTRDQISRVQGFPVSWKWIARAKRDILQMIANAVPAPMAKSIGEVILARHRGETRPAIEGRFTEWLVRGGRSQATARNVKANVGRARRLLGGRTYVDVAVEIVALEASNGFDALSKGTRSDLRQALRFYDEFQKSRVIPKVKKSSQVVADDHPELAEAA